MYPNKPLKSEKTPKAKDIVTLIPVKESPFIPEKSIIVETNIPNSEGVTIIQPITTTTGENLSISALYIDCFPLQFLQSSFTAT